MGNIWGILRAILGFFGGILWGVWGETLICFGEYLGCLEAYFGVFGGYFWVYGGTLLCILGLSWRIFGVSGVILCGVWGDTLGVYWGIL